MSERTCRAIEALALALWIGALAGFAFVFAPIAFRTVPSMEVFATLVAATLRHLTVLGAVCGTLAIACEIALRRAGAALASVRTILIAVMLILGGVVVQAIVPRMEATAAALGAPLASVAKTDPRRVQYDGLHAISSRVYGVVLLLGVATIVLAAIEQPPRDPYRR